MKYLVALLVITVLAFAKNGDATYTTCEVCTQIMTPLKQNIAMAEMLGKVMMGKPCNRFPEKYHSICEKVAAKNIQRLAQLIKQDSVEKTCKKIKLCGKDDRKLSAALICDAVRAFYSNAADLAELFGDDAQEICESTAALDPESCENLPSDMRTRAQLVRQTVAKFSGLIPFTRCDILVGSERMTQKQKFLAIIKQKNGKNMGTAAFCGLCKTLIGQVQNGTKNADAYGPLKDTVATALEATYKELSIKESQGEKIVAHLRDNIFDTIHDLLEPVQVCSYIGCPVEAPEPDE
uniref:Saposin B-type domain-containing protein n=1 Tax=Plectus sambesii TaxID=2011161 RepID=A0A914W0U1_9BILA